MPENVSEQAIRQAAYEAWIQAGEPIGNDWYFWLRAEQEYLQRELDSQSHIEDVIQEASEESFPASDAPAWNKTSP